MRFRKRGEVTAVTFDELVEYGKSHGGNIVNGMPWSFNWCGFPVTHENDSLYLIIVPGCPLCLHFQRGMVLVLQDGVVSVWEPRGFYALFEEAA